MTLDTQIAELHDGARAWTHLTLDQRARLLTSVRNAAVDVAADWARTSAEIKGLDADHPLRGEEWLSGPYAIIVALDAYIRSLRALARGTSPLAGVSTSSAPGGRVAISVFPAEPSDRLILSGFRGEVWLRPGVSAADARRHAGLAQLCPTVSGGVGLVLGAGNVTAIPVLDVLYELIAHNRMALLKLNPTMDPLAPLFLRLLTPLIEPGFVRVVTGGPDVGATLTAHPRIDHVHITGAATTFDAIVWGPDAADRKRKGRPVLDKPITAELGGVSPVIVVPGRWTDADLRYQAENIASMRLHNSGHNCIAAQVVLLSADWPQRAAFLDALRAAFARAPQRPVWYPRADEKLAAAASDHPDAEWSAGGTRALVHVAAGAEAPAVETTEYFAPVLGVVEIPGTGAAFLDAAVAHANDALTGSLGAHILIDPVAERALGDRFDQAIADLRYGTIAINAWTGFVFGTPTFTWGAFPGNRLDDIGSGTGIVHNALLIDGVERSVGRAPFRPFPRALRGGERTVMPKPPWFVTARTAAAVSEGLTRYRAEPDARRLLATLRLALKA